MKKQEEIPISQQDSKKPSLKRSQRLQSLTIVSNQFGEHLMNCKRCGKKYREIIEHIQWSKSI